jgi:hypothetical protein
MLPKRCANFQDEGGNKGAGAVREEDYFVTMMNASRGAWSPRETNEYEIRVHGADARNERRVCAAAGGRHAGG